MFKIRRRPLRQKSSRLYEESMAKALHPDEEKPSWKYLASLGAYVVIAGGIGVALAAAGEWLIAVFFLFLGILVPALVVAQASASLPRTFGRRTPDATDELGDLLGEGGSERARNFCRRISGPEFDVLDKNRAAEAEATRVWLDGLGEAAAFADVETTSDDGVRLAGHVLAPNPSSPRWLVFAHGLDGTWRAGMTYARRFAEKGFNLLFVEERAHGASGGDWVGLGLLERRDLVAWARWLVDQKGVDVRITLMGVSEGGAATLCAAGEKDLPTQVAACVSDSAYSNWWNVAVQQMSQVTGQGYGRRQMGSAHPLLDLQRLILRRRAGYDLAAVRPVDAVAHAAAPVFVAHGEDDETVMTYMARDLDEAAGGAAAGPNHRLLVVPSAGHCVGVLANPESYYGALFGFLDRVGA